MLQIFVDLRTQIQALRQFSGLLNGTQGYLLLRSLRPVDGVHNRSGRPLPTTALQGSCPCSLCVEQTMIPSLDQIHRQSHLPVDQEAPQPLPRARLGDHRTRITYLQGRGCDYNYNSSVSCFDFFPFMGDMYST